MFKRVMIFFFMFLGASWMSSAFCQVDSLLPMDRLETSDINYDQILTTYRIISASRSLKSVKDLPFSIHVIGKEEILRNGYNTLVDVLKYLPGIKVSQPGSALEGETFLMRGLLGNAYTKILVNDLPVKPTVVSGMPIGAQLPIRQAERIEIIYGTGAATYGADASAGVINIITKDSERPLFVNADLMLGPDNFNGLNLMVGGKLGRNKNVLKFNVYGNSTQADHRRVVYDVENLYDPDNYFGGSQKYLTSPNYRERPDQPGIPVIGDYPHLSRMLGVDLRFRGFRFSYHRMYRRDPSATGLNPAAVSSANPLNFIGENISRYTLSYTKDFQRFGLTTNLTYLGYKMDNQSSYTYVKPTIATILDTVISVATDVDQQAMFRDQVIDRLLTGSRFSYAESNDYYIEQLINYFPFPFLEVVGGVNYRFSQNFPIINFLNIPFRRRISYGSNDTESGTPFEANTLEYNNFGAFAQLYLTVSRFNLIGGVRWDRDELFDGSAFSPRLAAMYKIRDDFRVRASFGRAFRTPTPFYNANTYTFTGGSRFLDRIDTGGQLLDAEITKTYEMGMRWDMNEKIRIDASIFQTKTANFISYNFTGDFEVRMVDNEVTIGYFNDENSNVLLYGAQAQLKWKDVVPSIHLGLEADLTYSTGNEALPFESAKLDAVRMQPEWLGHLHLFIEPWEGIHLGLRYTGSSSWIRRIAFNEDVDPNALEQFAIEGFSILDFYGSWKIHPNFQISAQIFNAFDQQYGGISATGFLDDLAYNPQQLRHFRFGINYFLN